MTGILTRPHGMWGGVLGVHTGFLSPSSPRAGQWTETGMSGRAGAPALPAVPRAGSSARGSATGLPMGVPSARATGWRLETVSCSSVQVREDPWGWWWLCMWPGVQVWAKWSWGCMVLILFCQADLRFLLPGLNFLSFRGSHPYIPGSLGPFVHILVSCGSLCLHVPMA